MKDKFEKSGLTTVKSDLVDAPIINELPIAMECEFIEYQNDETGIGVIGKVVKTSIEEANMSGDKVNIDSLEAIAFDPYTHGYYKVSEESERLFQMERSSFDGQQFTIMKKLRAQPSAFSISLIYSKPKSSI